MSRRGQLVLAAAALVAVALLPVVAAYLQLGYAPAAAATVDPSPSDVVDALADAVERVPFDPTPNRTAAASRFRDTLTSQLRALEAAGSWDGAVVEFAYAPAAAASWAAASCPGGPNRQFGSCVAADGVVVQERADTAVVVAVAVHVRVVTPNTDARLVVVLPPR